MTLKLSHKAYILILLPLICQLVFIASLSIILQKTETEAQEAKHAQLISAQASMINFKFFRAAADLVGFLLSKNDVFSQQYTELAEEIPKDFAVLKKLVRDDAELRKPVTSIEQTAYDALSIMNRAKAEMDMQGNLLDIMELRAKIKIVTAKLVLQLRQLSDTEQKKLALHPDVEDQMRILVKRSLFVAVLVNIIVAFGLAIYFNQGTAKRHAVLVDNARRLARDKTLNEPLTGNDEIADIDRAFHEMASQRLQIERLKQEFTEMVSHDLRAPLSSIQVSLRLLASEMQGQLSDRIEKNITIAERESTRLISLVNDLLEMDKLESSKLELKPISVSLTKIIEDSVESISTFAEHKEVQIAISCPELTAFVDPVRLTQVLVNLLSNAIKFAPAHTTVNVHASRVAEWVEVRVRDEGSGIPAGHEQSIFSRFYQVNPGAQTYTEGSGLGLAICKAIIEQHGGSIGVETSNGQGSTFWFRVRQFPST